MWTLSSNANISRYNGGYFVAKCSVLTQFSFKLLIDFFCKGAVHENQKG